MHYINLLSLTYLLHCIHNAVYLRVVQAWHRQGSTHYQVTRPICKCKGSVYHYAHNNSKFVQVSWACAMLSQASFFLYTFFHWTECSSIWYKKHACMRTKQALIGWLCFLLASSIVFIVSNVHCAGFSYKKLAQIFYARTCATFWYKILFECLNTSYICYTSSRNARLQLVEIASRGGQ